MVNERAKKLQAKIEEQKAKEIIEVQNAKDNLIEEKRARAKEAGKLRGEDLRHFPVKNEKEYASEGNEPSNKINPIKKGGPNELADEKSTTSINISQECMNELNFICKKLKINKAVIIDQLIS